MANSYWPEGLTTPHPSRQAIFGNQFFTHDVTGYIATLLSDGPVTDTQPGRLGPQDVKAGDRWEDWIDVFYYKIRFRPDRIDLGNVLGNQSVNFVVWNAYFEPRSYTALSVTGETEGLTLNEPIAPPTTLPALQAYSYDLDVSTDGPFTINVQYSWVISGEVAILPVTGVRSVVFPFLPNWRSAMEEGLAWLTRIERVKTSGLEQTAALRQQPRRDIAFEALLSGDELLNFEQMFWGWSGRLFALPIAFEETKLDAAAAALDTVLYMDTTELGFVEGDFGLVWVDYDQFEAFRIDTLLDDRIICQLPLQSAWPFGASVFPINMASLRNKPDMSRHTSKVMVARLTFDMDPLTTNPHIPVSVPSLMFEGLEVIREIPNWVSPLRSTGEANAEIVDTLAGGKALFWDDGYTAVERGFRWMLGSREEINEFRALMGRRKGRAVPLWIPSRHYEWELAGPVSDSDGVLLLKNNGWLQFLEGNTAFNRIAIIFNDDTIIPRKITNLVDNQDGTYNASIDSPLGITVALADVEQICHLGLYRFASDRVNITYRTQTVGIADETLILKKASS